MTVYIVDLESVDTRYTGQWKVHVPALLVESGLPVKVISGPSDIPAATTPGAFLNFGGTNVYKASQVEKIGRLFCDGSVKDGDYFLFTDAWHPGIINLKYMAELLGIKITIGGLWHAGSYDKWDFLGRLIGDEPWVRHTEKALYHALDHNYFATKFHIELFSTELLGATVDADRLIPVKEKKIVQTGWPMEYMPRLLRPYASAKKKNLVLFPHRVAPEKQVEIFKDLAARLPHLEFVVCQEKHLTKDEYHRLLGEAKVVFSANLQETLGISTCIEGPMCGALPLAPDRLSYSEIFEDFHSFKYPSEWTENWDSYTKHADRLASKVQYLIDSYDDQKTALNKFNENTLSKYFTASNLVKNIIASHK
jgi:hypothetical protein